MTTIACIDDNRQSRLLLEDILKSEGYALNSFEDAEGFLEWYKTNKPDMVILDICMPKMSGSDCLKVIRKTTHGKNIPIIAITALAMASELVELNEQDFQEVITKPIDINHVRRLVRELCPVK